VAKKLKEASSVSAILKLDLGGSVDKATAIQVLAFAANFFGSKAAARRAHSMMQAYFEMDLDAVDDGFNTLDLSPSSVARASGMVRL